MTWDLTRRDFLSAAGLMTAAAALPLPARAVMPPAPASLEGKLHIIGLNIPPGTHDIPPSVLTTLDLKTSASKRTELPISLGHAALPLGDGRIACISHHGPDSCIVDADHTLIKKLKAPEDYLYGGHGLLLPERGAFVVPVRHAHQRDAGDHGRFLVYDLDTLQELGQVPASALHPHEMQFIPGTDEIAVTHYGDINTPHPYYVHNVVAPALVIYDAATLKKKRVYQQDGFDAMLTHMDIAPDGHAYCVMTQYYDVPPADPALTPEGQRQAAIDHITQATGQAPDFSVLERGIAEGRIAMPLPVLRIDTRTGDRQVLMAGSNDLIRSQSVACNQETATAAATFFHADRLFLHRPGEAPEILTNNKLGLDGIRGVADIPDTPLLAVTGSARTAIILDTRTLDVIARLEIDNAHAPHVEYEKARQQ